MCIEPPARLDTGALSWPLEGPPDTHPGATITFVEGGEGGREDVRTRRKLDCGLTLLTGRGGAAKVEGSLPKAVRGTNVEGLLVAEGLAVLRAAYDEAARYVDPGCDFEQARVKRLDVVLDFAGVGDPTPVLEGLATVRVPGRAKQRRWADPERNRAETLTVGAPTGWLETLYDKGAETLLPEAEGQLRCETRLRTPVLTSARAKALGATMGHVADIEEFKLRKLRREMFTRVGFDRAVVSEHEVVERIRTAEGLTDRERTMLVAYLVGPSVGVPLRAHRNTLRKYDRLAAQLGVAVLPPRLEVARRSMRLDYDTAQLVVGA